MWNHLPNPLADQRILTQIVDFVFNWIKTTISIRRWWKRWVNIKEHRSSPFHVMIVRLSSGKNCCRFRSLSLDHLASFDDGQLSVAEWWGGLSPSSLRLRIGLPLHVHIDHGRTQEKNSLVFASIIAHCASHTCVKMDGESTRDLSVFSLWLRVFK